MCRNKIRKIVICLAAIAAILLYAITVNAQIIYQETLEYPRYFVTARLFPNGVYNLENCNVSVAYPNGDTAHGTQYDSTFTRQQVAVFRGNNAVRFSVWKGQPLVGSAQRYRSESTVMNPNQSRGPVFPPSGNVWYSFAVNFPSQGMEYDNRRCRVNQWFEDGSDETTLSVWQDHFYIEVTPPAGSSTLLTYDLNRTTMGGPSSLSAMNLIPKNVWHEYVFHIKHSFDSSGLIDIWRDGVQIHHIVGRNMHLQFPKWKIGIYESSLDQSILNYKVLYFDNIRIGDSLTTLMDMVSTAPSNILPVVSAGPDKSITLPTTTTSFIGSATDQDGTITGVQWTQISGPNTATIATPTSTSTSVSGLIVGVYQFQLTATDNQSGTGSDVVQVTVIANQPPTANAGVDQVITLPTNSVNLLGSGNDPDGSIVAYAWAKISGPTGGAIGSPNSAATAITGLTAGVYVYRLTVTDNSSQTATDLVTITVNSPPNQLPNANAGPDQTLTLPTNSTTLTGVGSTDPDGTITAYSWVKISGPTGGTPTTPTTVTSTITNLIEGTYVYQLTVTDNSGGTANDIVTIIVNPAPVNIPPTANAGIDQTITLPTNSTTVSGSGSSDPDGTIVSYLWVKISGPSGGTISSPSSVSTGITALQAGTYVFRLTVTDNGGATGTDAMQIIVNPAINIPPTADAGVDQSITLPTSTTTLVGSGNDPDGTIVSYLWAKVSGPSGGNITSASSATTGITALQAGTYVYRLTVTDNNSATGSDLMQVVVNPAPNIPPTADAGTDQVITLPTSTTTLNGSGSSDPDGTITAYLWSKVSGPTGGAITTPTTVSTGLTGLTQGIYVYSLVVTDNNGSTGSDLITIQVDPAIPPVNLPPVADAGSNQVITLPVNTTNLDGSGSTDPDGTITDYLWVKSSGPVSGSITSPTSDITGVTALVQGVYIFQLTVTDNNGDTGTASTQVTVLPCIRNAPNVNAGSDQAITLPTNSIVLSGTTSANNCATIVSTLWSKVSGGAATISTASNLTTNVTGLQAGTYIFKLLSTDNNGDTSSDVMQVIVSPAPNIPPTAIPGANQSIQLPTNSTTLVGSGTDTDGTITAYLWAQVSGPNTVIIASPTSATTFVSGMIAGTYIFRLTVTDNNSDTGSAVMQVLVNPLPNIPPIADAGLNQTITLPINSVILNATASTDPDGTIVAYLWSQSSGPNTATIGDITQSITNATGLIEGTYVFRVRVTDNSGDTATSSSQIIVSPEILIRPTANAGVDKFTTLPTNSVSATGTGTAQSGTITGYLWSQTAGPSAATITAPTSATTSFTGLVQGVYIMQFKVYDSNSDSAIDVMQVTVYPAVNIPPVLSIITNDTTIYLPENTVDILSTATDTDGSIVSIQWIKVAGNNIYQIVNDTTLTPTITNLGAGTYVFRMIVTDSNGATSTADITITVVSDDPQTRKWFNFFWKVFKY